MQNLPKDTQLKICFIDILKYKSFYSPEHINSCPMHSMLRIKICLRFCDFSYAHPKNEYKIKTKLTKSQDKISQRLTTIISLIEIFKCMILNLEFIASYSYPSAYHAENKDFLAISWFLLCRHKDRTHLWWDQAKHRYIHSIVSRAIFCWKPHQNWTYGFRDIVILVMLKTIKYKGNWMLLLSLFTNHS